MTVIWDDDAEGVITRSLAESMMRSVEDGLGVLQADLVRLEEATEDDAPDANILATALREVEELVSAAQQRVYQAWVDQEEQDERGA